MRGGAYQGKRATHRGGKRGGYTREQWEGLLGILQYCMMRNITRFSVSSLFIRVFPSAAPPNRAAAAASFLRNPVKYHLQCLAYVPMRL